MCRWPSTPTRSMRQALSRTASRPFGGLDIEEVRKRSRATIPMGRYGTPEEFADVAVFHLSDLGNARRLVARHGQDIRYVSGIGWLVWDGCRFRRDDSGGVVRLAKETVTSMFEEAAQDTEGHRQELVRHALHSEANSRINAMITLASPR